MKACLKAPTETLAKMGEAAKARVLVRHNVDAEVAKLVKLFQAQLGS